MFLGIPKEIQFRNEGMKGNMMKCEREHGWDGVYERDCVIFEKYGFVIETRMREEWQEQNGWFPDDVIVIENDVCDFRVPYK